MKTLIYPISPNYMQHWGIKEAVRELLQNAIDSGTYSLAGTNASTLLIANEVDPGLTEDNLLLFGESSKSDGTTIGKFGEGLKLALLVLARAEVRHAIRIVNEDNSSLIICGHIRDNRLVLEVSGAITEPRYMNVSVECQEAVLASEELLVSKQQFKTVLKTGACKVMTPGGKLFVSGLFICDTKSEYSYNFTPDKLQLDRDRSIVGDFNLAWETSRLWADCEDTDKVVELIFAGHNDVKYISNHATRRLLDAVYAHYLKTYGPGTILAESAAKAEVYKQHYQKVVYVGGGYANMVSSHKDYVSSARQAKTIAPSKLVQDFVDANVKHMRAKAQKAAVELKLTSLHWS